jgi:hypothetical protein
LSNLGEQSERCREERRNLNKMLIVEIRREENTISSGVNEKCIIIAIKEVLSENVV